jgi:fructoselysine-6-P-deglycase FrlB-like protein
VAKEYAVEQVMDRMTPDGKGSFEESVVIIYTVPEGYRGSVTVAKKGMTPETVKAAVEADVAKIRAIYKL